MKDLLCSLVILFLAPVAVAGPITYIHEGTTTGGSIGNRTFSETPFAITAIADTNDIRSCGRGCVQVDHQSASIALDGIGTFSFLVPTRTFAGSNVVGFSRSESIGGANLFDLPLTPLGGWMLDSAFGPISGAGFVIQWDFPEVVTDGGVLFLNRSAAFLKTFAAVTAEVPEPATIGLLSIGLLGFAHKRRRATKSEDRKVL